MKKPLYLCLDQGGSSSRAIVFDDSGNAIASHQRDVDEIHRHIDDNTWGIEQNPDQLVESLRACAESVVEELDDEQRSRLKSCGLITQRSSMVAYRKDTGKALTPVISWQDTRASQYVPASTEYVDKIYQLTGLMPNAHFAASKMRWCLAHLPELTRIDKDVLCLAPLASYLSYHLLSNKPCIVDRANASRTLLLSIESGEWSSELLELFDLPLRAMPQLIDTDAYVGDLLLSSMSLPMCVLTGDQCAAAFSRGQPSNNELILNVGTGAFLLMPITEATVRNGQLNSLVYWRGQGQYMLEATINGAGSAIHAMAKELLISDPILSLKQSLKLEADTPQWINTYSGLGSPDWRNDIASHFINDEKSDREQKLVAVAESVLFLVARNLVLMKAINPAIERINMCGGLAQLDELCQRLSDLTGVVVVRDESVEASARGAAFLLAGQPSIWPKLNADYFNPKNNSALWSRYSLWEKQLLQCLVSGLVSS